MHGDGLVVSVLALYFNDPSLNLAEVYPSSHFKDIFVSATLRRVLWNNVLWLVRTDHMTLGNQSQCFISE